MKCPTSQNFRLPSHLILLSFFFFSFLLNDTILFSYHHYYAFSLRESLDPGIHTTLLFVHVIFQVRPLLYFIYIMLYMHLFSCFFSISINYFLNWEIVQYNKLVN